MRELTIGLITAAVLWLAQNFYKRFFLIKPKLYLSTDPILYSKSVPGMVQYHFKWTCPITIKNNSKYTAVNLRIAILPNHKISDRDPNKSMEKNSHIEGHQELKMETIMERNVPIEEIRFITYEENGTRVMTFQTKMEDPQEHYKPESLKNIVILLKYESETGKTFYTLYKKLDGKEINELSLFSPKQYSTK